MRATIAFNRAISAAYRHLGVTAPGFPGTFDPGQFVMVRLPFGADPLLPRAFSLYRIAPSPDRAAPTVEILYKVVGKATLGLSRMEPGHELELLGPLGNRFVLPEDTRTAILVAGGIGVPPIAALARHIRTPQSAIRTCVVFLGGKSSEDILCVQDFETAGWGVRVTTEDGSMGTRGLLTDILAPSLRTSDRGPRTIFTCGPPGMLAAVARLAETHGVPCQTSVEANMACGFGACMGCAVEMRSDGSDRRYQLVCKDGPVFDSRDLLWR